MIVLKSKEKLVLVLSLLSVSSGGSIKSILGTAFFDADRKRVILCIQWFDLPVPKKIVGTRSRDKHEPFWLHPALILQTSKLHLILSRTVYVSFWVYLAS